MTDVLETCLQNLQSRIDEQQEAGNLSAWLAFLDDQCEDDVFVPPPRAPAPAKVDWPEVSVNAAMDDPRAMLLQQFGFCSQVLAAGGTDRLGVRCNYGTCILPLLFGCEPFMMDESLNTLPTVRPLGSSEKIHALLEAGPADLDAHASGRVFSTAELFLEVFDSHPVLERHVSLFHPDAQGPIDIVEMVWGSDVFYALHDEPETVRELLGMVTDTYAAFMRKWFGLVGPAGEDSTHWGMMHRGALMIRNDSLMNLSPQTYVDLIRPMDDRLLDEFDGGAIHFCGRADHHVRAMSELPHLTAVNLSQPELNDMELIYRNTVDRGIKIIGLAPEAARAASRPLRGQVHCRTHP